MRSIIRAAAALCAALVISLALASCGGGTVHGGGAAGAAGEESATPGVSLPDETKRAVDNAAQSGDGFEDGVELGFDDFSGMEFDSGNAAESASPADGTERSGGTVDPPLTDGADHSGAEAADNEPEPAVSGSASGDAETDAPDTTGPVRGGDTTPSPDEDGDDTTADPWAGFMSDIGLDEKIVLPLDTD